MAHRKAWAARWVEPAQEPVTKEPAFSLDDMFSGKEAPEPTPPEARLWPPKLLKRGFEVPKPVRRAELAITARGLYLATINGRRVTEALFTPEFTSYDKIILYQTYDVTGLLRQGGNVWGIVLADGWYAGRVSTQGNSAQFGDRLSVIGELRLDYADGTSEVVCTDATWRSTEGKYVYADIQIGEKQDLRLLDDAWDVDASTEGWDDVTVVEPPAAAVVAQEFPQVVRHECLAVAAWWREGDAIVVDFGQVIAGRVSLECTLAAGQQVRLEHSEVLDREGRFFMNIIGRNKDSADVFVGRGTHEVLEPDFTFHGFRYVRLTGWEGEFDPACMHAHALYSDLRRTGSIRTSDERVNQLISNIEWSQRGNMLSIPTDCPQRERMGWTGDIQVFAPTGCFFMDMERFLLNWLDQVMADQLDDGQVIDYSPATSDAYASASFLGAISSAGWGDAIVLVPWALYRETGHVDALERCYDAMLRWHGYCVTSAAGGKKGLDRYVWDTKFHYGDWMLPSFVMGPDAKGLIAAAHETGPIVATCFLAHTTDVLACISELLGHDEAAAEQRAYAAKVREAYVERFCVGEGALSVAYQGTYVLALAFDMLPEAERAAAAERLAALVTGNGRRLDTGFLSMPYLLDVLEDWGYADLAADVFWQDGCPGWLYEVDKGATTIWENWANIAPDGTVGANSFNHYSFGCVADWIVRKVGGLALRAPGYAEFDVAPAFVRGFTSARLSHETGFGTIELAWSTGVDGARRVELTVPEGTTAHVRLPGSPERTCGAGRYLFAC